MTKLSRTKKEGLSNLQKFILSLANKQGGIVLARDVLIHHYGFTPSCNPSAVRAGGIVFDKATIGHRRYRSASTAVCKPFNRLVDRELAVRILSGIRVDAGGFNG